MKYAKQLWEDPDVLFIAQGAALQQPGEGKPGCRCRFTGCNDAHLFYLKCPCHHMTIYLDICRLIG